MIPFSRRELHRAWSDAYRVSKLMPRSNAHRLLLFYAAECGLKAVWLMRNSKEILEDHIFDRPSKKPVLHDLNKLLDVLHAGSERRLPALFKLPSLRRQSGELIHRSCDAGDLNQVWRYGAKLELPNDDSAVEKALEVLNTWLAGELR